MKRRKALCSDGKMKITDTKLKRKRFGLEEKDFPHEDSQILEMVYQTSCASWVWTFSSSDWKACLTWWLPLFGTVTSQGCSSLSYSTFLWLSTLSTSCWCHQAPTLSIILVPYQKQPSSWVPRSAGTHGTHVYVSTQTHAHCFHDAWCNQNFLQSLVVQDTMFWFMLHMC